MRTIEKKFRHVDLFSGIGGFAYAAKAVWQEDYETVFFCDNDKFCQEVLRKRFPEVKIWGDIRELITDTTSGRCNNGSSYRERGQVLSAKVRQIEENKQEGNRRFDRISEDSEIIADTRSKESRRLSSKRRKEVSETWSSIDLLTGGFPCQPFSQAGKRGGKDDNRYLWPAMLECIRLFKPRWVLAENVSGILSIEVGLVFEQVCTDMEKEGYEVWTFIIPAAAVNAPHRRDRVWFIGYKNTDNTRFNGNRRTLHTLSTEQKEQRLSEQTSKRDIESTNKGSDNAKDTDSIRRSGRSENRRQILDSRCAEDKTQRPNSESENASDTKYNRCDKYWRNESDRSSDNNKWKQEAWNKNWIEVAAELCGIYDGFPAELDGLKLSKSRHRVERLKSLGNAIVPQVAIEIMKSMKEFDENAKI